MIENEWFAISKVSLVVIVIALILLAYVLVTMRKVIAKEKAGRRGIIRDITVRSRALTKETVTVFEIVEPGDKIVYGAINGDVDDLSAGDTIRFWMSRERLAHTRADKKAVVNGVVNRWSEEIEYFQITKYQVLYHSNSANTEDTSDRVDMHLVSDD